ncbi:glutamic acid-rich protein-like [Eucalyptus grandis]|uniref:glutamic acid-rich protein-like n=1 Tax=Eucalyptus grandis TaxID=71139 RepID=UPI00192EE740|nr:glutamic acid-rich protein-like [Eucalyptus grandis]
MEDLGIAPRGRAEEALANIPSDPRERQEKGKEAEGEEHREVEEKEKKEREAKEKEVEEEEEADKEKSADEAGEEGNQDSAEHDHHSSPNEALEAGGDGEKGRTTPVHSEGMSRSQANPEDIQASQMPDEGHDTSTPNLRDYTKVPSSAFAPSDRANANKQTDNTADFLDPLKMQGQMYALEFCLEYDLSVVDLVKLTDLGVDLKLTVAFTSSVLLWLYS